MKSIIVVFLSIITLTLVLASCYKKPDIEYTDTYKMAGEWFVQIYNNNTALLPHHEKILTYNTAVTNSGKIWIDDQENIWPFKTKVDVEYSTMSFKPNITAPNDYESNETVKVIEGKVLPGVGRSKTGVTVDSIYLKLEFSDDPGEIYELRGHQRTGFFEDEY